MIKSGGGGEAAAGASKAAVATAAAAVAATRAAARLFTVGWAIWPCKVTSYGWEMGGRGDAW